MGHMYTLSNGTFLHLFVYTEVKCQGHYKTTLCRCKHESQAMDGNVVLRLSKASKQSTNRPTVSPKQDPIKSRAIFGG